MALSRRRIAIAIARQLAGGVKLDEIVPKLAAYLIETKQVAHSDEIIGDVAYELSKLGSIDAAVTTARPLTDELRELVRAYVKQTESVSSVTLTEQVDEALIGGIIVETPSKRLDASVISKLKQLKTS